MALLLDHQTATTLRVRDVRKSFILINAEHNPVTSMAAKGEAPNNTLIEWPLRRVPTSTTVTGTMDGLAVLDADFQNFEDRKTILQGRLMKIREAIGIGDIADTVTDQYGMDGSTLFGEATKMALMKARSRMEAVTVGTQESVLQSGTVASSPVPFVTRGLSLWVGKGATGDLPITDTWAQTPANSIFTTAANADNPDKITEANVRAVCRSVYNTTKQKGNWMLFCSLDFQEQFNNFVKTGDVTSTTAPLRRFNGDTSASEMKLDVQTYVGPAGRITLIPHMSLPAKVFGLLLDMQYVKLRMARNARFVQLTEDGSGPRGFVDAIFSVCCENPTAMGKFIQLT